MLLGLVGGEFDVDVGYDISVPTTNVVIISCCCCCCSILRNPRQTFSIPLPLSCGLIFNLYLIFK